MNIHEYFHPRSSNGALELARKYLEKFFGNSKSKDCEIKIYIFLSFDFFLTFKICSNSTRLVVRDVTKQNKIETRPSQLCSNVATIRSNVAKYY